jgi:hypothetical protein
MASLSGFRIMRMRQAVLEGAQCEWPISFHLCGAQRPPGIPRSPRFVHLRASFRATAPVPEQGFPAGPHARRSAVLTWLIQQDIAFILGNPAKPPMRRTHA